jgi:hypothetical protein
MSIFAEHAKRYAGLEKVPLRIEAHTADAVVTYQGLHLDSILTHPVVMEATNGAGLPNNHPYEPIPLPIERLWTSPDGVPVWAATDLVPKGEAAKATRYWHRRAIRQDMTLRNIRVSEGQHKELRSPMPTVNAEAWIADVIGNAEEITRLLAYVSAIGKKRGTAGAILKWVVYEIQSFDLRTPSGAYRRAMPFELLLAEDNRRDPFTLPLQQIAVSPPYWHHNTQMMAIPAGTVL